MKKAVVLLITLMAMVPDALAVSIINIKGDLKVLLPLAVQLAIGVVVSSVIIAIGLWIYKQILKGKEKKSPDSKAEQFTCEIDDTKTIAEAIRTFLIINK